MGAQGSSQAVIGYYGYDGEPVTEWAAKTQFQAGGCITETEEGIEFKTDEDCTAIEFKDGRLCLDGGKCLTATKERRLTSSGGECSPVVAGDGDDFETLLSRGSDVWRSSDGLWLTKGANGELLACTSLDDAAEINQVPFTGAAASQFSLNAIYVAALSGALFTAITFPA